MNFGEKLYKLRKEKGFSQEALAEKLNTTRQAVSKWENNQGFPETEKLLMLGNIFGVSIDHLLKQEEYLEEATSNGYFVSREKAESYLLYEKRTARNTGLATVFLIVSGIPLVLLKHDAPSALFCSSIFIIIGVILFFTTVLSDRHYEYSPLKQNPLLFDPIYLTELQNRYKNSKKKYVAMIIFFPVSLIFGSYTFIIAKEYRQVADKITISLFLLLTAFGIVSFIYAVSMMDAYDLLVQNERYTNKLSTRIANKLRRLTR